MVAVTLKLKKSIIKRINLNWLPAILKARIFAYNGEKIKAIKACKYSDLYVLSKAGLHLQVIERSKNPSVELALAYAATNQHEQAFAVIDKIGINKQSSIVLGILAIQNPSCVAKLLIDRKGFDKVKAYCHSSLYFESALQFCEKKITDWHNLALSLKSGNYEASRKIFNNIFSKANLLIPKVTFENNGLIFSSLSHYETKVDDISKLSGFAQPLISVVMTLFNMEETVLQALSSIQQQTWNNLEIIVVNDGSNDNTARLIKEAGDHDPRIKIINLNQNVGLWKAKNIGLSNASGEYITMHDADDWSHAQKIELQITPLIEEPMTIASISYMVRIEEGTGELFTRNAMNFQRLNPSSLMLRKEIIQLVGIFREDILGSDIEYIERLTKMYGIKKIRKLNIPLSFGLHHDSSLSNKKRYGSEIEQRMLDHEESLFQLASQPEKSL